MEPRIQYCRTSDGVNIAYATEGSGVPFVVVPNLWSNIAFTYQIAPALLAGNLQQARKTIMIDGRGLGASQREVMEVSLETRLLDLEAVTDHLALDSMILFSVSHAGPAAITYAARHPDRVAALIMLNTYANGAAYYELAPVMRAFASIEAMAFDQWDFYTRTAASAVLGYAEPEIAERLAALYRGSVTPDMLVRYREASRATDVRELLSSVRSPTLVLDDRKSPLRVEELSRELAAGIPGARLVTFDGGPLTGAAMTPALDEFLGVESAPIESGALSGASDAMTAILFVDIADSTRLTERLGDAAFRDASRALEERLRHAIRESGGTAVEGKVLGDGVMGVFSSASRAIEAARRCVAASAEVELPLHIGMHAGDVIRERDNVYGGAVNIASRICGLSQPGEILVSATIRDLARTSAGVMFDDRGEHVLKGIDDAVRVFAVR